MKFLKKHTVTTVNIFDGGYICGKSLYDYYFSAIPSTLSYSNINVNKGLAEIRKIYERNILATHANRNYNSINKQAEFNEYFIVMKSRMLIEFGANWCVVYHSENAQESLNQISEALIKYKAKQRRKPREINVIVRGRHGLELKAMEIRASGLNIELHYNDDFAAFDEVVQKRLKKQKDKGIVLLHGLPGTGKTTYLRYLVSRIKKRVLFLSPSAAADLMSPEFIQLLIDTPNCVVVIEDAENILMDRKISGGSSVSNLLNISDGLLADFLNVQIICTFNNALTLVDKALMRQGRLIAKYEFGKLEIEKAQRLSDATGFNSVITKPMTIAEIANQHEKVYTPEKIEVIGFRRQQEEILN